MNTQKKIIVVGAGIIGASLAYRLVQMGAEVTLVDQKTAGGEASSKSFGWINATYENPKPYYELRKHSMDLWPELASAVPQTSYQKTGTLYVHFEGVELEQFHREHSAWGYGLEWIDKATLRSLEPNLKATANQSLLCSQEALVEPHFAARAFANACQAAGATLQENCTVKALSQSSGRVVGVQTDQGTITADEVVLACGAYTSALAATADVKVPLNAPQGLLIHTKPLPALIRHTLLTEGLHIQQKQDGALLAGADFGGGKLNDDPVTGSAEILRRIQGAVRGAEMAELDHYTLGKRPTPIDGMPIVGRPASLGGMYVAVMHSGATLAAGVSQLAAEELLNSNRHNLLHPFGVNRFT